MFVLDLESGKVERDGGIFCVLRGEDGSRAIALSGTIPAFQSVPQFLRKITAYLDVWSWWLRL